jgi:hypothetical protein
LTEARSVSRGASSKVEVASPAKCLAASFAGSWHAVHARPLWSPWAPDEYPLYWDVPEAWHDVQLVFGSRLPVDHAGVVRPPWQLTALQV